MGKPKKESNAQPVIKVCPECQGPYKIERKGCQSCGCELLDKCPSCDEPFEEINLGKKVKYCNNCLKPLPSKETLENERTEPSFEEKVVLLLEKAKADRHQEEQIKAEKMEYEKLKAQEKIDF